MNFQSSINVWDMYTRQLGLVQWWKKPTKIGGPLVSLGGASPFSTHYFDILILLCMLWLPVLATLGMHTIGNFCYEHSAA